MKQDKDPLTANLSIFWGYTGGAVDPSFGFDWIIWHGHGPVRKIEKFVDHNEVTPEDWMEIADKAVAKMEEHIDLLIEQKKIEKQKKNNS